MTDHATLHSVDGRHTVTFERRLTQPVALVWAAITEPEHLEHWFPTTIDGERAAGAHVDFRFRDAEHSKWDFDGTITEFDPPAVFALRWGDEDIRFVLTPDGAGTLLRFTSTFGDAGIVVRDTAGWHVCLDSLAAHVRGEDATAPSTSITPEIESLVEHYRDDFGAEFAVQTGMPD